MMAREKFNYKLIILVSFLYLFISACSNSKSKRIDNKNPVIASKIKFVNNNSTFTISENQSASLIIMFNKPTELVTHIDWTIFLGENEFEFTSGQVILNPGESSTSFSIKPLLDNLREGDETFQLMVGSHDEHVVGSLTIPVTVTNITSEPHLQIVEGTSYNFDLVSLYDVKSKIITVQNTGQALVVLESAPTLPLPFDFLGGTYPGQGGTCGLSLDGNASCTMVLSMVPLSTGVQSANLDLNYFDYLSYHPLQYSLSGEGVSIEPTISGVPTGRNTITNLNISVSGAIISQYKYKVGNSNTTDCASSSYYSSPLSTGDAITDSISSLNDGGITLCVVAKNNQNVWQSLNNASQFQWVKDTTAPTLTGLSDDLTWTKTKSLSWACGGDDSCTYRFVVDQNPTTDISALSFDGTSSTEIPSGSGDYYIHIQALDSVGYVSAVYDFHFHLDNTPPVAPTGLVDGLYKSSTTESPPLTWNASTDGLSSVVDYQYALGSTFGSTDIVNWTSLGSNNLSATLSGLTLVTDSYYYPSIRAVDEAGNVSDPLLGDGWLADTTAPGVPVLVNDGFISTSLASATISWSAGSDGQSGVASYEVAVGTTPNGTDVLNWVNVGLTVSTTQVVSLTRGGTYYGSVRVIDNAGNVSASKSGDGWIATGQFNTLNRIHDDSAAPANPRDVSESNFFGSSVAISEDGLTAVVGVPMDDLNDSGATFYENSGAAYVYSKSSGAWVFQQKLVGSGTNGRLAGDQFGYSVSISGNLIAVGAPQQDYDANGASAITNAGAVYIYSKNVSNGVWSLQQKIVPSGTNARVSSDQFGWSVSISGTTVAVSSPWQDYDDFGNSNIGDAGAVFIYTQNIATEVWSQEQKIIPSGTNSRQNSDFFGYSISLNGNSIAVGSYGQDYDSAGSSPSFSSAAGAAFIFTRSGSVWSQQARITPSGTNERMTNDQFGIAVSLHSDTVVIGSNYQGYDAAGANLLSRAGAAYVYVRNSGTGVWSFQQKLVGTGSTNSRLANDNFGYSVFVHQDTVAIGAYTQDYNATGASAATDAGAVYVFVRNAGTGVWSVEQKIVGSGTNGRVSSDYYGFAVALNGNNLIVGAKQHDYDNAGTVSVTDAGAVFTLARSGSVWSQELRLSDPTVPSQNRVGSINSLYGSSVAISEDQTLMVVGAPSSNLDSSNSNYQNDGGVAYVYEKQLGAWVLIQKISPTGTNSRLGLDNFGASVAISQNTIVVGSPRQDYDGSGLNYISDAGAAYVFVRESGVWSQQAKLVTSGTSRQSGDQLGASVAIRGDTIVLGSPYHNFDNNNINSLNDAGAIFIFNRNGTNWTQSYKLTAPSSVGRATSDILGFAVSISTQGDYIAAGAPQQDTDSTAQNSLADAGAVYIFKKANDGSWSYTQKIIASGTNGRVAGDKFGYSVSMDSNRLVVGSPYQDTDDFGSTSVTDAGAIFVFYRSTNTYIQEQKLTGSSSMTNSRVASDNLGFAVAISGDVVAAGVPGQDFDLSGLNSVSAGGACYIFVRSSGLWAHQQKLIGFGATSRQASDDFGRSVGLSGDNLVIGARNHDYDLNGSNYITNTGSIFTYIF